MAAARSQPFALSYGSAYVYPTGIYMVAPMTRSTVFKTNRSQAVRLPKAVAFPEGVHDVEILKLGAGRLVVPVGKRWDDFFDHGPYASDDFMGGGRSQLAPERREDL